jgi:hypothetical protein
VKLPRSTLSEAFKNNEQRGSIEETQRILQEIERINAALGYTRKQSVAFPRQNNDEYFYPRPPYHPLYQTKDGAQPRRIEHHHQNQQITREIINQRTFYAPMNVPAVFMYPMSYVQVPPQYQPSNFRANRYIYPPSQVSPISKSLTQKHQRGQIMEQDTTKIIEYKSNSAEHPAKLERYSKTLQTEAKNATKEEMRKAGTVKQPVEPETSLIEDLVDEFENLGTSVAAGVAAGVGVDVDADVEDALEEDEEDKEDDEEDDEEDAKDGEQPQQMPVLANDKFLNTNQLKKMIESQNLLKNYSLTFGEQRRSDVQRAELGSEKLLPFAQDISNIFRKKPAPEPLKEQSVADYDDKIETEKAPSFLNSFSFRPRDQELANSTIREGGLVIQRLRVRQGGIAIAGPGGVATAGSGGTAIVGPGGVALTHPRGLAIGGPGARIYELPNNIDLEQAALKVAGRSIPYDIEGGVLVATGPVVYYHAD